MKNIIKRPYTQYSINDQIVILKNALEYVKTTGVYKIAKIARIIDVPHYILRELVK